MMFTAAAQASGGNERNIVDENSNSNCSSYAAAASGFTLWDESVSGKKGQTRKENNSVGERANMRADVATTVGQWPVVERRSQSLTNNHMSGFSSRSSSQGSGFKSQSFMDMIRSAKGSSQEDDLDDEEDFIMKKESSSTSQSHRVDLKVKADVRGSSNDQKLNTPRSKHSATEQRRRSKINDRFQMLRQLIPNSDQKRDKASFLLEVIEYIQFLQEKADKYETSYQGWNHEPAKLLNWQRNNQQLVPEGTVAFAPKLEEVFSTNFQSNSLRSSPSPISIFKSIVLKKMGLKRPFDAEEMQECNAKHARQLSYSHNQLDEAIPYHHVTMEKTSVLVEGLSGLCENPTWTNDANHAKKGVETCAPFSWIPVTDLCQEDSQSGGTTQSALSHQSSGSDFTWRPLSPVEDVYTCLMNQPPRKQVLVGSNHQADIPEFVKEDVLNRSESTNGDLERKLMGKCIIPMPDSDVCGIGQGRKECLCSDKNSIRCVRRHIMEARESLIESIGYERFTELGFCEMGEEVASLWTDDEEDLFHRVVYSNPFSMGRDFWKQLKATFPSRNMKELVSYYFNVFISRRRAAQNRFKALDIDSDDDEWQVEYNVFYGTKSSDEEDSNGNHSSHEDIEEEEEEEEEEETNSNDDDDDDSPSNDDRCVYMDKASRDGVGEEVNVEDDSCMSFELQDSNLIFAHSQIENREYHRSGDDSYSFDDRRLPSDCWNKNNDLLPTSNIIEEIFGQDDWVDNDDDNLKGK